MLIPGKGMGVLQNSKKFRVRVESVLEVTEAPGIVARAHRTCTSSGYGYECRTELTEVPGTGLDVVQNSQNSQKFRVRVIPGENTPGMVLHVPYRTQPCKYIHTRTRTWGLYTLLPLLNSSCGATRYTRRNRHYSQDHDTGRVIRVPAPCPRARGGLRRRRRSLTTNPWLETPAMELSRFSPG